MNKTDTIYSLSTLYGKSGVAVFRISGKRAFDALKYLNIQLEISPRTTHLVNIINPVTKELIDKALVVYFKAPNSFTGEDVLELHTHGSIAVINELLDVFSRSGFMRLAEPGEFSRRAFYNQKMDLVEAEGLADLIEATTQRQKQLALRQVSGQLTELYESWRYRLIGVLAKIEALIDFPDEDVPEDVIHEAVAEIQNLNSDISAHVNNHSAELISHGLQIALIGAVNAGKSTILNTIANRDVAIVSDEEGTTRDLVEARIDIDGYLVNIFDTAGFRNTENKVENEGIRRSKKTAENADLVFLVVDTSRDINEQISSLKHNIASLRNVTIIYNKTDLSNKTLPTDGIHHSSLEGSGKIINYIKEFLHKNVSVTIGIPARARYQESFNRVLDSLNAFDIEKGLVIASEEVRSALSELGKVTGRVHVEDVLDQLFGSFCIGK